MLLPTRPARTRRYRARQLGEREEPGALGRDLQGPGRLHHDAAMLTAPRAGVQHAHAVGLGRLVLREDERNQRETAEHGECNLAVVWLYRSAGYPM